MPSVFGYWNLRGLGHYIRLLLKYVEEDFEDKIYRCGPEVGEDAPTEWLPTQGDFGKSWFQEKSKHSDLDFPNIPYYKDDKVKITQSTTIMRYLARKYDLEAQTEQEKVRLDLVADQCSDFKNAFAGLFYSSKFHEMKEDFLKTKLPLLLQPFEDFIGDRPWFVGTYITWVDFYLYEFLVRPRNFWPGCFQEFPKLSAFLDRFEALPQIKAYMSSEDFIKDRVARAGRDSPGEDAQLRQLSIS